VEKTGGNPFFIEQLLLDLRERGAVVRRTGSEWVLADEEDAEVPTTIGVVLIARLDRLVAQIKAVVQTAAVLGREFEVQVLSQMLRGEEGVPARVRRAEEERIWTALSEVRYLFRHALLRDAAYDMQLRARLRELHRLAVQAIEQVYAPDLAPYYPDLAYHYGRAEEVEGERRYARLAGEQAAAQYANVEAVTFFSRALALTPEDDLADRYALLLAREKVRDLQGNRELQAQDLAALEALTEALADDQRRAEVHLRQARYAEATGSYPAAIAAAQRIIGVAQTIRDVSCEASGYLQWGHVLLQMGDYEAARLQLQEALKLAGVTGLRQVEADSLQSQGEVFLRQGDHDRARAVLSQAMSLYREAGDRQGESSVYLRLGSICGMQGDYATGRDYAAKALSILQQIGDRQGEGHALRLLGNLSVAEGIFPEGRTCFERGLRISREIGDRRNESILLGSLGTMFNRQGNYARARTYQEEALHISREIGDRLGELVQLYNLGNIALSQSDYDHAQAYSKQAWRSAQEIGDRRFEGYALQTLGRISFQQGDYAQARTWYEQALPISREIGGRELESALLNLLSLLFHRGGDDRTALDHSQQAWQIAEKVGDPVHVGNAFTSLGHALAGLGRLDEATDAYRQAAHLRRELGQLAMAMEPVAGLASVALAQGALHQAQAQVEEILEHLETGTQSLSSAHALEGAEEPFWVYLTCYEVLRAAQDPRAEVVLNTAYNLLQELAAKIEDKALRRSLLENVPHHQEIVAAYQAT